MGKKRCIETVAPTYFGKLGTQRSVLGTNRGGE